MKKEAQVVMLSTDKLHKGCIVKSSTDKLHCFQEDLEYSKEQLKDMDFTSNYLYIVDDSEIKEGDLFIHSYNKVNAVCKAEEVSSIGCYIKTHLPFNGLSFECNTAHSKKIIGTTDPELHYKGEFNEALGRKTFVDVPKVPESFIESYCKNPVEKVMVEYDYGMTAWKIEPISTSNNELIIHPIEEKLYTREEVAALCKQAFSFGVRLWEDWEEEDYEMWCKFKEENL